MSTGVVKPNGFWLWAAGIILLDQLIKAIVRTMTDPFELGPVSVSPILNTNGFLGADISNGLLILIGGLIVVGLVLWLAASSGRRTVQLGIWLILAGALSNLLDRIFYGGAVDVIQLVGLSHFNLADVSILVGAGVILFGSFRKTGDGSA